MESIQRIGDWFVNEYRKNGLKWLNGVKYTSMVASPILAAFGAVRAYKEMEKRKKEGELSLKDKAVIVAKNEAAAFTSMVGGIAASAKVDHDMKQTIDALTTMVVLGENKIRELKEAEKEVVGEEKREEIQKKADRKDLVKADSSEKPEPGKVYKMRCAFSGIEIKGTAASFEKAKLMMNYDVINGFEHSLGEFLGNCNIDPWIPKEESKIGDLYGWIPNEYRSGYQDIDIEFYKNKDGEPVYLITYSERCEPVLIKDYIFE